MQLGSEHYHGEDGIKLVRESIQTGSKTDDSLHDLFEPLSTGTKDSSILEENRGEYSGRLHRILD